MNTICRLNGISIVITLTAEFGRGAIHHKKKKIPEGFAWYNFITYTLIDVLVEFGTHENSKI